MVSKTDYSSLGRLVRGASAYALLPLVGLITAPLLARALGPDGRGQLASVIQPWTVADAVLIAGLPTAVAYFVGRGHKFRDFKKPVLLFSSCTCVVAAPLAIVYSGQISTITGINRGFIIAVWSTSLLFLAIALRRAVLQGQGNLGVLDMEKALFAVSRLALIVAIVLMGITQIEIYVVAYIVPGLAVALVLLPRRKQKLGLNPIADGPAHPDEIARGEFYPYALLAGCGYVANTLGNRLDQALLPLWLDAGQLGIYAVAVTLAELPLILSTVAARNLLSETSRSVPRRVLLTTAIGGLLMVTSFVVVLWVLTPWLVPLIFGAPFADAVPVAQILLIGIIFATITEFIGVWLAGTGHAGRSCVAPLIGVVVLVLALIAFSTGMTVDRAAVIVVGCRIVSSMVAMLMLILTRASRKVSQH